MKKILLTSLICLSILCANAQCTIEPFIQQNYEDDAKTLTLVEILSDINDPDYDNPFVPQSRIDFHLEKLSALYQNPNNVPELDSIFNEFQYHVQYSPSFKEIYFRVETGVSWVQPLKDTGVSGLQTLDNLLNTYQLAVDSYTDYNSCQCTWFKLETTNDFLNLNALVDDLESIQDVSIAEVQTEGDILNYTGIPYNLTRNLIGPSGGTVTNSVESCSIIYNKNTENYEFFLGAEWCLSGCITTRFWYANVSNDCSVVNFSRTLSTEDVELTNVSIYPNPASDILTIQGVQNIQHIELYTIQGKQLQISLQNETTITINSLQSGMYFLKVTDDQNRSVIRKFIKK